MLEEVMIVGQAPSRTSDPEIVLQGRCGEFLRGAMRLTDDQFGRVQKINVMARWIGKSAGGKGDLFAVDAGRVCEIKAVTVRSRYVFALGWSVASALGARCSAYFEPTIWNGTVLFVVPHPSGINRWWNETSNRRKAARFFRRLLEIEPPRFGTTARSHTAGRPPKR